MLVVKLSCEDLCLFFADRQRIANLLQNGIVCSKFIHLLLDQLPILRDAERLMLRAKLDELLGCEHISEVELGGTVADAATVAEMHQRCELQCLP